VSGQTPMTIAAAVADADRASGVDAGVVHRHFVAIATGVYDDPAYYPLPVADEVSQLRAWVLDAGRLGDRVFTPAFPELADGPGEAAIRAAFHRPQRPWTERDASVVFVTGHGQVADDTHWLVLRDSEAGELPRTAFRTADLIRWLKYPNGIRHLLLIIDACFAGAIAKDTVRIDDSLPREWLILPSATKNGEATALALTTAIGQAVQNLHGGEGERYGTNRRYFRVSDFIDTVRRFLGEQSPGQELDPIYRGDLNAEHVCLPNPHYRIPDTVPTRPARHELALPRRDLEHHWTPRAVGAGDSQHASAAPRWLFTGRAALMRELIATARGDRDADSRVTLVTGGAGCGKSAVLARLVTLSDPDFAAAYPREIEAIPADLKPGVKTVLGAPGGGVDIAVVATAKYAHEVIGQLSDALGAARPDRADADLHSRIGALTTTVNALAAPVTVVVDALDEAEDPLGITRALAQLAQETTLRLLVGVRSPSGPDDRLAAAGPQGSLADQAEALLSARRLRVDEDPWWHQGDVWGYAESVLLHTPGSPYQGPGRHEQADQLAEVIAGRIGRTFLVARLAAAALTRRPGLADPADPAWLATLDEDVVGVFRADLIRAFPEGDARLAAVELLRAVAFAYGKGLPWGEIWPLVANAVADRHGKFGDRDIAWLLASPISAYLVTDVEDDTTAYRLFHDALRGALRTRWRDLVDNQMSHEPDETAVEARITKILRALLDDQDLKDAPRYLLRSLPGHAQAAGLIDELLADDAYLLHADLQRLLPAADSAVSAQGRRRARMLRLTPQAIPAGVAERAALFSVTEALEDLGTSYRQGHANAPYRARWARVKPRHERAFLTGHQGSVRGVCPVTVDGQPMLASASDDRTVGIWDPATGQQHAGFDGHQGSVTSVCPVTVAGQPMLASASDDRTVRIWNPATGQQHARFDGHQDSVTSVCPVTVAGQPMLASGDSGGTVRIWNPTADTLPYYEVQRPHAWFDGHQDWVWSVCPVTVAGQPMLASASSDRTVRIWNPTAGTSAIRAMTHYPALAVAEARRLLGIGLETGLLVIEVTLA
jgi:WD domain, G-beta repeat